MWTEYAKPPYLSLNKITKSAGLSVPQEHITMFSGSIPALVTLFADDGSFAESAYRDFIEWQIAEGSTGLVPCGTTGEAATMSAAEHFHAVRVCVDQAAGRVPVIAGAGSNDTRVAIENIKASKDAGADAALMVPPYYNRPNQEGIFRHFEAVANACDLPIVLYNVPGRTVTDIHVETMGRLARAFPSVVGVKDATGVIQRVSAQRDACGADFCQISVNDDMALAFNATVFTLATSQENAAGQSGFPTEQQRNQHCCQCDCQEQ